MGNPCFQLDPFTLTPPAPTSDDEDAAAEYPPWVLLESLAYVANCENGTTAFSKTWDGKDIQVTICPRRPPCVSYLCVYSPDSEIPVEPKILAMEEDLVVLRITVGCQRDMMTNIDYYVYRAADRVAGGKPSLTLLKRPPSPYNSFYAEQTGILHCGKSHHRPKHGSESRIYLRPHVHVAECSYIIAALKTAPWEMQNEFPQENFILSLYHSKKDAWTVTTVSLNQEQVKLYGFDFEHANSKVITIGGDAGTMAFVDLWRGILFCDIIPVKGEAIPPLRYVELPSALPNSMFRGDARLARDIAVINKQLKFVELRVRWKKSRVSKGDVFEDGWMAITWSRPISCFTGGWCKEFKVDTRCMDLNNNPYVKSLPKVLNDEDMILPPFKRIDICQPTLGLHEDGSCIVYFMIKKSRRDRDAWILVVDMKMNTLLGITSFAAARNPFVTFAYTHSRISKYLPKSALGAHGHLNRPRVLLQSSSKLSKNGKHRFFC